LISGFFALAILFGILRFHSVDANIPVFFESQVGQKVQFLGIIIDEPEIKENSQKLIIETENGNEKVKILLSADFIEEYRYGDEVNFSGKLEKPENFITDYGKEFDYINYLKKDGIFYVMNFPKLQIISHENGNKIKSTLFFIKEKFLEKINFSIKEPESLLMGGLILGEKASFNQELRQSFINTGTIHIVALSGYNITIVAEWIMKLFAFLPKNFGFAVGIGTIILFILMTGGSTTAIRAGIMAILALIARATGRNYGVARALILAGVFMVFFNPLILVYDVSFQLSFIATIAVIFIAPKIEKYFTWITKKFGLRDIISVTCAAYIFVMPFILYKMGTFSIVALPANILILPFIPFTMAFGFFTGLIGFISNILALPFGIISYIFLHYELFIIGLFSKLPFSSFSIPNFPLIFTILIYLYFIYRIFGRSIKNLFTERF
jgi:competence protein ComEC